ncbi:MAG: Ref family recombination enhancement nuclease [Pseudomonadota bacterium]
MNIANLPPMGLKPDKEGNDPDRLEAVAQMPCVICHEFGEPQLSATQVHHCIHGRYSTARAPDCMTIPLCEGHHQGLMDTSKVALHGGKSRWRALYGNDTDWISWVEERL